MQTVLFFRSLFHLVAVLVLMAAFTLSSRAQSTHLDEPTPMANGVAEGVLPGGKAAHYWSFTAGPGEVNISYVFDSKGIATVGAQLTDVNGRVVIELNQREKFGSWAGDEITDVLASGSSTLAGRYQIPRRQTLVVKVYVDGDKLPFNYRIRVRSENVAGPGPGPSNSTLVSGPEAKPNGNNAGTTASRPATGRRTSSAAVKARPGSCLAEYQACLKRSIILKTPGATSQCIIQRAYCERRQRSNSATSGPQTSPQGVGETAGQNSKAQQGTKRKSKQKH